MSAIAGQRRAKPQEGAANRHQRSKQPSREELQRRVERQQREIEDLRDQLARREKQLSEQEKQIAEHQKKIADAGEQIADLERQLGLRKQNSTNSSKPPSSDGLAGEQRLRGRKRKSRRQPGAQPGHAGHHRPLVPTTEVSAIEVLLPCQCGHCGERLPQNPRKVTTQGNPRRHQVTEIPPIQPHITEYQFPDVVCGHCGKTTRAPLPDEIAGHFGPQLAALIAYLTVVCRMPRRVVEALLAQVLGIEISLGSTQKCWEEASQAVSAPCQELERQLRNEPVINVDETGWRTNGDKRFLWAFVAARYVVYRVASALARNDPLCCALHNGSYVELRNMVSSSGEPAQSRDLWRTAQHNHAHLCMLLRSGLEAGKEKNIDRIFIQAAVYT